MYAQVWGASIIGIDGFVISVEVDISRGLPCFEIVGLANAAVKESKERVRVAIQNSGYEFPLGRIVVNLAPADMRKESAGLDLPIALGILHASGQLQNKDIDMADFLSKTIFVGELSLNGEISPIHGGIAMAIAAKEKGLTRMICPTANGNEVHCIFNEHVHVADFLRELLDKINGNVNLDVFDMVDETLEVEPTEDLDDVKGQITGKRVLEIAAAGSHHILFSGPPGAGKTMLAKRLTTIMPPMTLDEQIAVTRIYSVAGLLPSNGLLKQRPFRSPHHTITISGMAGGGNIPKPGELTLSHHGVLFLDEVPEFKRPVLEVLRQPMEEGCIHIARSNGTYTYPSQPLIIMAKNPCPCGWLGSEEHPCTCTAADIYKYKHKLSGPLLDRIDMSVVIQRPSFEEIMCANHDTNHNADCDTTYSSKQIKTRVIMARERQLYRQQKCNGLLSHKELHQYAKLTSSAQTLLATVFREMKLSVRSHDRILRVALTIADLERSDNITDAHLAEAISYRSED